MSALHHRFLRYFPHFTLKQASTLAFMSLMSLAIILTTQAVHRPQDNRSKTKEMLTSEVEEETLPAFPTNQLLVKLTPSAYAQAKRTGNPHDTGIPELTQVMKDHQATKFEQIAKPIKNPSDPTDIYRWYLIETAGPGEIMTAKFDAVLDRLETPTPHGNARRVTATDKAQSQLQSLISQLSQTPGVETVEPNYILTTLETTPNDPYYPVSGSDTSYTWGMHTIDVASAWDITTGSSDVVVAVIDTGVDYTHEDLAANIWTNPAEIPDNGLDDDNNGYVDDYRGWDFANNDNNPIDDHGHGTHCSGTIGAIGNNGIGVVGVSWHVKIMPIKFLDNSGSGSTSNAIKAIQYATTMQAMVTSNSWGSTSTVQSLLDALEDAYNHNIVNVVAAGNSSMDALDFSPANSDHVITVSAFDINDQPASFTNFGEKIDVAAPGVNILSTVPGNQYAAYSGTSMACPHSSGLVALIKSVHPDYSIEEIRSSLRTNSDNITGFDWDTYAGYGRINAYKPLNDSERPAIAHISNPIKHSSMELIFSDTINLPISGTAVGGDSYSLEIQQLGDIGDSSYNLTNMLSARSDHTATSLSSERVLITGGSGLNDVYHQSTEIFDATSNNFSPGPNMSIPRYLHTATTLNNGQIILIGGRADYSTTTNRSTDLYDPAVNQIIPSGSMSTPRAEHTATLLTNGNVLIAGGDYHFMDPTQTAEIYHPDSHTFTPAGNLNVQRYQHTATLLDNGKVLIVGGRSSGSLGDTLASAELYDPTTNTFSLITSMTHPRFYHTASKLPDGKVLVAGGYNTNTTEIFDPNTNTFSSGPNLSVTRINHEAVTLPDNSVIFIGTNINTSVDIYDPTTHNLTTTIPIFNVLRGGHTATLLLDGQILIAGGIISLQSDKVQIYSYGQANSGIWQTIAQGTPPVNGDQLGVISPGLAPGNWQVKLTVNQANRQYQDRFNFLIDNDILSGWPIKVTVKNFALGNFDADDGEELAVIHDCYLTTYQPDSTPIIDIDVCSIANSNTTYTPTGIAVYDLDSDGKDEIITMIKKYLSHNYYIYLFTSTGDYTHFPGFPLTLSYPQDPNVHFNPSSGDITVGDVNGDSMPEIFLATYLYYPNTTEGERIAVYGIDLEGHLLNGWPQERSGFHEGITFSPIQHSLKLIDLDHDSDNDIIHASFAGGDIYAWDETGQLLPGWPYTHPYNRTLSMAVTYRQSDHEPIVAFSSINTPRNTFTSVCGNEYPCSTGLLNSTGQLLPGWPKQVFASPYFADIDTDDDSEIIYSQGYDVASWEMDGSTSSLNLSDHGGVLAFTRTGSNNLLTTVVSGYKNYSPNVYAKAISLYLPPDNLAWEKSYAYFYYPLVSDIDKDNQLEIITYSRNHIFAWNIPDINYGSANRSWPTIRHDSANSNNADFDDASTPPEPTLPPTATPTLEPTQTPTPTPHPSTTPSPVPTPSPTPIPPSPTTVPSPTATPIPQLPNCQYCYKGICDNICHPKRDNQSLCPDCVQGNPTPNLSPTPPPTQNPDCAAYCFKGVCDNVCHPSKDHQTLCPDCPGYQGEGGLTLPSQPDGVVDRIVTFLKPIGLFFVGLFQ